MTAKFIDKYEIISTLGRGSMGVVYKGRDPEIGRLVAIKTLKTVFLGDDPSGNEALQRFRQESRSAGKLHHPNIVTIFEAGKTDNGSPYIVMEYIEGKSLEALIAEKGMLEPGLVLHSMAQIASAVDYAHSQNVIHRDIKPSNILLDTRNRPHLLDFGVAKLSDTSLTPAGTVVGTPSYMSPEQIRGTALDGRTDLFSLAVVCFEVFTGVRPFPGNDFSTVVGNIIHKQPLRFEDLKCALPSELERVLGKGLLKDRNERFGTATEFVESMAAVFDVAVDNTGLIGGYSADSRLPPRQAPRAPEMPAPVATTSIPAGAGQLAAAPASSAGRAAVTVNPVKRKPEQPQYTNGKAQEDKGSGSSQPLEDQQTAPVASVSATAHRKRESTTLVSTRPRGGKRMHPLVRALLIVALGMGAVVTGALVATLMKPGARDGRERAATESPQPEQLREDLRVVALPLELEGKPAAPEEKPPAETKTALAARAPAVPRDLTAEQAARLTDGALSAVLRPDVDPAPLRLLISEAGKRANQTFGAPLLMLTVSGDYTVRVSALKALNQPLYLGNSLFVSAIAARLNDDDEIVRGYAAKILSSVKSPLARDALAARQKVESSEVVKKVIMQSLQ